MVLCNNESTYACSENALGLLSLRLTSISVTKIDGLVVVIQYLARKISGPSPDLFYIVDSSGVGSGVAQAV
jgi:hypothetical protein